MKISIKGKYLLLLLSAMLLLPMMAYAEPEPEPAARRNNGASWVVKNQGRRYNPRTGSYNRSYGSYSGGFRRNKAGNPHIVEKMRFSANLVGYHTDNGPHIELWGKDKNGNSYITGVNGITSLNPANWRGGASFTYLLPACKYANWRIEGTVGYLGNKTPFEFSSIFVEPMAGANLYPSKKGGFYFTLGASIHMAYIMKNSHINNKKLPLTQGYWDMPKGIGITPMAVGGLGCEWRVGGKHTIGLEGTVHMAVLDYKNFDTNNFALSMDGKTSNKDIVFFFVGINKNAGGGVHLAAPNFYAQLSLTYSFDLPTRRRAATFK